jgi:hypothetical protein
MSWLAWSAMFWGCITHEGVGTFTEVDGNIDSQKYINILDTHLWPVIARHFPNNNYLFQDDNAPVHSSLATRQWKTENNIRCLTISGHKHYRKCVANNQNQWGTH